LPIPSIDLAGPAASAVVLADRESSDFEFEGVGKALALGEPGAPVDVRLFGKPNTLKNRRMGVALARAETVEQAKSRAIEAAGRIRIQCA
jgi:phosphoribosylglycinamide formyltransferase 2